MKKSFHKTLIAASVGAVMLAAVGTASANSLLFPYFTNVNGAQSVLSLNTNTAALGASIGATAKEAIHYVYNWSDGTTANTCQHTDRNGFMSANDLLQHSINDAANGGFGKAYGADGSTPFYLNVANSTGFLTVSTVTTATARVMGDMAIVDPANGLAVAYAGIDNKLVDTSSATGSANEGNYSSIVDLNFDLTSYPTALVSTSYLAVVAGDMSTAILAGRNWGASVKINGNGMYDNDEVFTSGSKGKVINCQGAFASADLIVTPSGAVNGSVQHATSAVLPIAAATFNSAAVTDTATGLVLLKVQKINASVGGAFGGKTLAHRLVAAP